MSDVFKIQKEQGYINIIPEIQELGRRFYSEVNVTEFSRTQTQSVDWALPAAVALFLARPFFEELMKSLGKGTGEAIIAAFKKQFGESKRKASRLHSIDDLEFFGKSLRKPK